MQRITFTLFAFLFSALLITPVIAQEKYKLKYDYPDGKYEMLMKTDMDTVMDMGMKITTNQKQEQHINVVSEPRAADGTRKVSMEWTRMIVESSAMGQKQSYDSANEKDKDSPLKMLGGMVGAKLTMTMDKDNNVLKVDGIDEFWDKLTKDMGEMEKAMMSAMKEQLTGSMTNNFDSFKEAMPNKEVAVGEKWTNKTKSEIPMLGKVDAEVQSELKNIATKDGAKIAEISSVSEIKSDEHEVEMGPMKMKFENVEIKTNGVLLLEIESGLVTSNIADTEMKMTMSTPDAGDNKNAISVKGKTSVSMKRSTK